MTWEGEDRGLREPPGVLTFCRAFPRADPSFSQTKGMLALWGREEEWLPGLGRRSMRLALWPSPSALLGTVPSTGASSGGQRGHCSLASGGQESLCHEARPVPTAKASRWGSWHRAGVLCADRLTTALLAVGERKAARGGPSASHTVFRGLHGVGSGGSQWGCGAERVRPVSREQKAGASRAQPASGWGPSLITEPALPAKTQPCSHPCPRSLVARPAGEDSFLGEIPACPALAGSAV